MADGALTQIPLSRVDSRTTTLARCVLPPCCPVPFFLLPVLLGAPAALTVMGLRLLVSYLAAKAMKLVAWAEPVWAVRPCSRNEEFPSQARTSWKSPSPLKVKLAPSKVVMWGSPNIQAGRKERPRWHSRPGKDLRSPNPSRPTQAWEMFMEYRTIPGGPLALFRPHPNSHHYLCPAQPFPNAMYKAPPFAIGAHWTISTPWPQPCPRKLVLPGPGPEKLLLPSCSASALPGPSSLTGPRGQVPRTADARPPLLVQGAEGRLVVPAAAPVLWLQVLICGEEQHVARRQRTCRRSCRKLWWGRMMRVSKGMAWESCTPRGRSCPAPWPQAIDFLPCRLAGAVCSNAPRWAGLRAGAQELSFLKGGAESPCSQYAVVGGG